MNAMTFLGRLRQLLVEAAGAAAGLGYLGIFRREPERSVSEGDLYQRQ
jgi:hypothetical protein